MTRDRRVRWAGKKQIGADTRALLLEAGYAPDEIHALAAAGVIVAP